MQASEPSYADRALVAAYLPDDRRKRAAEHCRRMVRDHPKAWDFARSTARLRACSANRRAAKSSTCGSEIAARAVENRDWRAWVLAGDLSEFSRNWIERTPHGMIRLLEDGGLKRGNAAQVARGAADFCAVGGPQGYIRRIEFRWGSTIEVFSSAEDARGSAPHLFYVDEAQRCDEIVTAIMDVIGPAMQDQGTEIWLSGTPGKETDTLFGQIATGATDGWELHTWYSWDNPHFGVAWRERFEAHILGTLALLRALYEITDEQWAYLEGLTERTVTQVATHPIGSTLHESALRELFGVWVRSSSGMVFALGSVPAALWGPDVDRREVSRVARGDGLLSDFLEAPARWASYAEHLPKLATEGPLRHRHKRWYAILSADLGHYPDPFALVAELWSPQDPAMYELDSCKALNLGEDHQREALLAWLTGLRQLDLIGGVHQSAVVIDSGGGGAASIQDSWHRKVTQRFGVGVYAAEKHATGVDRQVWLMNVDIRTGRFRVRRGSPLEREMLHLQWRITDAGRKVIDDKRMVALPDGTRAVTGDHCCDGARYGWYYGGHMDGRERDPDPDVTEGEMFTRMLLSRTRSKSRRRRRR